MSCKPTYKGKRYNSLEELYKANGVNPQQKQQAQQVYSQYLDSLNKPNTNPILQGNQEEQVKKFAELQERLNNKEFLEGAKNAYESTSELQQFGTQEQYNDYIARVSVGILPNQHGKYHNSKVKDIVYHGTNAEFENFSRDIESFKLDKNINRPFYFTTSKTFWNRKNRKTAILNIPSIVNRQTFENNSEFKELFNKIIEEEGSLHGITTYDKFLSEVDRKSPYPFENPKVGEYLRKNNLTFETPEGGQTYTVFEPEQIHILGSKQDIEGFKSWVDNSNIKEGVPELFESNTELANAVYEALGFKTKADVILPIGTSGSGKSTFIKSLPQENLVVIEPDAMRVEFTGDMNDKSKDKEIYEEAAKRAITAIKQGKQVVFDTTNLTKDKRLPFIEAIKKEIPNANIQYKLMELNPELAKQRIKAQLERGENRANVSDATIDRHAASYKQMLEDIKNEPISNFEISSQQKQQAQQFNTTVEEGMYVFAVDGNNANSSEVLLHITNISKINKNVKAANMSDFTSLPIEIKERILKRTLRSGYSDNVIMNASKNSPGFIIEFTVVPETEYSEPVDKIESISNETITLMDKITTDSNLVPVLFTNNNGALIGQGKDISKIVDENMSSVKYGNTNLELVKGDRDVVAIRMFEDFKNLSDNFVDVIQELITFAVNNADTQFVMSLDEFINGETTIAGRRIADLVNALYDLKAKAPNVIIVSSENVQTGVLALSYAVMSLGESLTNNIC